MEDALSANMASEKKSEETLDKLPDPDEKLPEVKIYSHTPILYWWPVWVCGFIMAGLSFSAGTVVETAALNEHIHPSPNPGIIFTLTFFAVLLFTNFSLRGSASLGFLAGVTIVVLLFALLDIWAWIFDSLSYLSVHMNMGFYLFFSSVLFLIWAYSVLIHVRFHYFRVRPGQVSQMRLIGEGETNYDSRGAVIEKLREDPFRHWILGLGSGDLKISTSGARSDEIVIRNILWVDRRASHVRKLAAVQPDDLMHDAENDS